jgi:hypothetical protein
MSLGAILTSSLLATLAHPIAWPLALAGFLVRGGIVLFLLPIVALPSTVGVSDRVAPILSAFILGGATLQLAVLFGALCALIAALLLLLAWFAAATEAALVHDAPAWDELDPARPNAPRRRGESGRILTARLVVHLPFAIALGWGTVRVVETAYRELSRPVDVDTPLVQRVIGSVPEVILAVVVTWAIGQILGAMAARRVVLLGISTAGAIRSAIAEALRRPLQIVILFVVPALVLLAVLLPTAAATSSTWERARAAIAGPVGAIEGILTILAFVGLWLGGLVLVSMVCAWRASVWTLDAEQRTFGVTRPVPPGDWSDPEASGTL